MPKITHDFLKDVLVTAVEGGSNHWALFSITKGTGTDYTEVQIASGDADFETRTLGLPQLLIGVERMLQSPKCAQQYAETLRRAVVDNDAGMVDAEIADLVLQHAMFNDVVYG